MRQFSIFLLVITSFLCACDDSSADDKREVIHQKETCYDKLLIIDIGGYKINAKRDGLTLRLEDGSEINYLHMKCDIEEVANVTNASFINFGISIPNPQRSGNSYDQYKHLIDQYYDTRVVLDNGTQRFQTKNAQLYLLPESVSGNPEGKPVLIKCSNREEEVKPDAYSGLCESGYLYSKGLFMGYRFFRNKYSEDTFIHVNQDFREKLKSIIVNTPNQGEQE